MFLEKYAPCWHQNFQQFTLQTPQFYEKAEGKAALRRYTAFMYCVHERGVPSYYLLCIMEEVLPYCASPTYFAFFWTYSTLYSSQYLQKHTL